MYLTPIQEAALMAGALGIILGILAALAGLHEVAHRGRMAGHDQPTETDELGERTTPIKW